MINQYENELKDWIAKEKLAIELINTVGKLWFDRSVELVIFRKQLVDTGASEILNHHLYAQNVVGKPITIDVTLNLAKQILEKEFSPSRIDLGRLGAEWLEEKDKFNKDRKSTRLNSSH